MGCSRETNTNGYTKIHANSYGHHFFCLHEQHHIESAAPKLWEGLKHFLYSGKKEAENSPSLKLMSKFPSVEQVPEVCASIKLWVWMNFETS